jgi:hypothetical protein
MSFFDPNWFDTDDCTAPALEVCMNATAFISGTAGSKCVMLYCITLRSRTGARITGWYDGSDSQWSTDNKRQQLFAKKSDARPVCDELRILCPRNAEVINIEAVQDDPSLDLALR